LYSAASNSDSKTPISSVHADQLLSSNSAKNGIIVVVVVVVVV